MAENDTLTVQDPSPGMGDVHLADDASMAQQATLATSSRMGDVRMADEASMQPQKELDRAKAKQALDQQQIYKMYPDLAGADKTASGTSDTASVMLNLAYRLNKPVDEVSQNYQMYRSGYAQQQGWDVKANDSVLKTKFQEQFQQEDARTDAIQNLQKKAIQDAIEYGAKGMSRNPLAAFSEFDQASTEVFKGVPQDKKLDLFHKVWTSTQQNLTSPEGQKALQLVNAFNQNSAEIPEAQADRAAAAGMNGDAPESPQKINPLKFLKGIPEEQQNKVLSIAAQLMASQQPEMGTGMKVAGGLGQAFARGFGGYSEIGYLDNLVAAQNKLKEAKTLEETQQAQDELDNLKLSRKIKQIADQAHTVNPDLKGVAGFAYDVGAGVAAMPGALAPLLIPVVGDFAFYKQAQAEDALRVMEQNPGMSAEEARNRVTFSSAIYGIVMGRIGPILGEAAPGVIPFLKHTGAAFAVAQGAEAERILARQLQSAIDPNFSPNEKYGEEWLDLLKAMPASFASFAAFGGLVKMMQRGEKPSEQATSTFEGMAGNTKFLRYLGFDQETAEKIAATPEGERMGIAVSEWNNRTVESQKEGVELAKEDTQKAEQIVSDPESPKLTVTEDGTHIITAPDENGVWHEVFRSQDADAANKAMTIAMDEHSAKKAQETPANDWTTATDEVLTDGNRDSKIPPDETGSPRQAENTVAPQEAALPIRTINASLASENNPERITAASTEDVSRLALEPQFQLADVLAGIFGKKIVVYTGGKNAPNGITNNSRVVRGYVFLKKDGPRPHLFTLGHELWHHLETDAPILFKSLERELAPLVKSWASLHEKYSKIGYKHEHHFSEAVADFLGDSLQDPAFYDKLRKQNPAIFQDFATRALEWLNTVLSKLKEWAMSNDHIRDIESAREMLAEGLHKYMIGDDTPIDPRDHQQWWKDDARATGERMRFVDDPIIAYLAENPIRSRTSQTKRNKAKGIEGAGEYDDQPKLPPAHAKEIFGGNQSIDQAHQQLIDLGYLPEDSSVSDLWNYIERASQNAVKMTAAEKKEMARQREEKKTDKELESLRNSNPEEYRNRLAAMEPGAEQRMRTRKAINEARGGYWENRYQKDAPQKDRELDEHGFYSKMGEVLDSKIQGKAATADQIKALITKPDSGIKPDEVKWSGILGEIDRLADENGGKVPKEALMDFVNGAGKVQFEEVTKGDGTQLLKQGFAKHGWKAELDEQDGSFNYIDPEGDIISYDDLPEELKAEVESASKNHGTQYERGDLVLPGGKNYREVVLTMPDGNSKERYAKMEAIAEKLKDPSLTEDQKHELRIQYKDLSDNATGYKGYTSSHFNEIPDYVAHMRLDERQDSQGRDGLFIEEIQSDRHQQGREKGYANEIDLSEAKKKAERLKELQPRLTELNQKFINSKATLEEEAERKQLLDEKAEIERTTNINLGGDAKGNGVPDAPFRKDWSLQMFKRALRDAVASGKEWIGWTSGNTQAERYDLSKQIDWIAYNKGKGEHSNLYGIRAEGKNGETVFERSVSPEELPDILGKEVAQKIINGEGSRSEVELSNGDVMPMTKLSGLDLKVGGEGMKGFYDQILPKEIGKYVKQWGGKVEEGSIGGDTYRETEDGSSGWATTPIWKIDITPEMREGVEKGQTRFSLPDAPTFKEKAQETLSRLKSTVRDLPAKSEFKQAVLKWSARSQASTNEIVRIQHQIEQTIPDKTRRDGITNWIEAAGKESVLRARAAASKDQKTKDGYEAALNLTKEEKAIAQKVSDTFRILETRAEKYGIKMGHRENYVPNVWEQEPQPPSGSSPKRLDEFFRFSQERTFENYFEGEQAGYKPQTKDIGKLLGLYMNDMNNAINSRRFVEELSKMKASDSRPLLSPRGGGKTTETERGTTHLVFPDLADEETRDYKSLDQPALHDWKFAGKTPEGDNVMTLGDLAAHPEIASHLNNALGSSAINRWLQAKTENPFLNATKTVISSALKAQSFAKGTMLSFSPFHQVQEGIHALGHRVNPIAGYEKWGIKIDLRDPRQRDAAEHGLMLAHDRLSQSLFMEGVGDNNSNLITMGLRKIGWGVGKAAADKVDGYQHWLFSQYIPALKLVTYEHIVERNKERYKAELASGEVSEWQVKNLSARQANAAYGHLNYTDMGHNPTIRHALQIALLAPDFLEARGRFVAQALKGAMGGKVGAEQLQALAFLAITQVVFARIYNKLANDDYEWDHPFEIRVGNKYYGMRSVPEDLFKLFHNTTGFIGGRISPLFGRFVQEGIFGVNYRGERTSVGDAIADILAGLVPMPLQSMTRQWTTGGKSNPISPLEQILSAGGVQVHRYSPITKVYPLAHDWVKENYPEDVQKGSYPVSKYQQLRYALEDNDTEAAQKEIGRLVEGGMKRTDIGRSFKESVNHPFTGSKKHDQEFYKSLDEEDAKRYDAAIERRKEILRRFQTLGY